MATVLRTRIAVRSATIILAITGIVGLVFLLVAVPLAEQQENARQQRRLNELLDTVQRTASIACFLSDRQLADEVARGLLRNRIVSRVTIRVDDALLARRDRTTGAAVSHNGSAATAGALVRKVVSPFNSKEIVGEIRLIPDAAEIQRNVLRATWSTALLLVVEILCTGIVVVVVVVRLIARPISRISKRLHELRAETGEKLEIPPGNETDEIGRLVRDVNAIVDYLVNILNQERGLRLQREIEEKKYRAIFEHADTGIFVIDEHGQLVSCNPAFARYFGLSAGAMEGEASPLLVDLVGEQRDAAHKLVTQAASEGRSLEQDIKISGKGGVPARWASIVVSPVGDDRLQGVVNDITERKRSEETAQKLAVTDRLTGLGNRLGFERRLEQMMDGYFQNRDHCFALLIVDLDRFKQVNDNHGHAAGDEVLVQVARRLENVVRKSDFVGRLGGDEFVVLLDATHERENIVRVAQGIIEMIGQSVVIEGDDEVAVGASVGAAVFGREILTRSELLRCADNAMYRVKDEGRGGWRIWATNSPA